MMKRRLLDYLRCDQCSSGRFELTIETESDEEVMEGVLSCTECPREVRVARGVPRFVPDDQYAENFSLEWLAHARTQLDSARGGRGSADAFVEKTGLTSADLDGAVVLDVGCGTGRFMEIAAPNARDIIGIDLSFAVDSAFANLGRLPNVHIVQASVFDLPFRPETFDVAYSIGVLHHTPSTKRAFDAVVPLVRHGGLLAVWLYQAGCWGYEYSDAIRKVTTRIPPRLLHRACRVLVPWALQGVEKNAPIRRRLFDRVPISRSKDRDEAILDTFDWYSPMYQWKHDWDEVRAWYEEAGFDEVTQLPAPVAFKGRRA